MGRRCLYLYEDVPVLKNLPGIKNNRELKLVERNRNRTILRIIYSREYEKFTTETLCDIHRTIFSPLYEWAGEFRTISIRKAEKALDGDTVRYAAPSNIKKLLDGITDEITGIQPAENQADTIHEIVRITAAIWQVHPFREGNTRSIVVFSVLLAAKLGIKLEPTLFARRSTDMHRALVLSSQESPSRYYDLERIFLDAAGLLDQAQENAEDTNPKQYIR